MASYGNSSDYSVEVRIKGMMEPSLARMSAEARASFQDLAGAGRAASTGLGGVERAAVRSSRAVSTMGHSSGTAAREFRALFDEISSGRMYQMPSTLAILAQRVAGVGTGSLIAAGAVAGLGYAIAELALHAVKANAELRALETQAISTAGVSVTIKNMKDMADALKAIPHVSQDAANSIVEDFLQIPSRTKQLETAFPALIEATMRTMNTTAAKAGQELAKAMTRPLEDSGGLAQVLRDKMNPELRASYEAAIKAGNGYAAQAALARQLADTLKATDSTAYRGNVEKVKMSEQELLKVNEELPGAFNLATAALVRKGHAYNQVRDNLNGAIESLSKLKAAQRVDFGKPSGDVTKELHKELAEIKRVATQRRRIASETAQSVIADDRLAFREKKATLDAQVALGRITGQQEADQLIAFLRAQEKAQIDALTKAEQNYGKDKAAFAKAELDKKRIAIQTEEQIAEVRKQLATKTAHAEEHVWKKALHGINRAEDNLISGLLSGRETLYQALLGMAGTFAEHEIETEAHSLTKRLLLHRKAFVEDVALGHLGAAYHALIEGQKTASTVASVATRTAAKAAGASAGVAVEVAAGHVSIMNDAMKAAAGAYAAMAGIPIIGPELGAVAAAGTFAAVSAFDALKGLEVGAWEIPNTMPALLHAGETVLPRTFAEDYRANVSGGGNRGSTQHVTVAPVFQIAAMDSQDVRQWVNKNARTIAGSISRYLDRNPSVRPSY